ncbi:MAG TPA: putative PEP-binding protein [Gammaproteobacteria bacterium]|nr:putative PEP-binding protein [Gammaproteobacteria bacterium]
MVRATPYVPGRAHGRLERGPVADADGRILVLAADELAGVASGDPPAGIAVVAGAPLSHPMLRLFALGCPVVILDPARAQGLPYGRTVTVDGGSGLLGEEAAGAAEAASEPGGCGAPGPGVAASLGASVGDAAGARRAREQGADAIGLVRSEYLFPEDGRVPDGPYYRQALGAITEAAGALPVTVRLPDLSVDKPAPWLGPVAGFDSPLGRHGSRLFDVEPVASAVAAEARVVGELAGSRRMGLIVPFLTGVEELARRRQALAGSLPPSVAVGAMIETPAAGLDIAAFLRASDFAVIGCNDLMQTLFAADRDVPEVAALLDPYAPVMLRFLAAMAEAAGDALARVTVCGLLPQLPGLLPVLLGLGFRTFSVEPLMIPHLRAAAAATGEEAARALAGRVCAAEDSAGVREELGLPPGAPWSAGGG